MLSPSALGAGHTGPTGRRPASGPERDLGPLGRGRRDLGRRAVRPRNGLAVTERHDPARSGARRPTALHDVIRATVEQRRLEGTLRAGPGGASRRPRPHHGRRTGRSGWRSPPVRHGPAGRAAPTAGPSERTRPLGRVRRSPRRSPPDPLRGAAVRRGGGRRGRAVLSPVRHPTGRPRPPRGGGRPAGPRARTTGPTSTPPGTDRAGRGDGPSIRRYRAPATTGLRGRDRGGPVERRTGPTGRAGGVAAAPGSRTSRAGPLAGRAGLRLRRGRPLLLPLHPDLGRACR